MLKNRGGKVLEYTVRKAVPSDKARVEALFMEMLQAIYNRKDVEGYREGDIDRFFAGAGDWICVAEAEGRVEAFLSIEEHHEPADYIYLDDFSVSTPCRGRGIGMALLKAAEQYARDRGIPRWCSTWKNRTCAPAGFTSGQALRMTRTRAAASA